MWAGTAWRGHRLGSASALAAALPSAVPWGPAAPVQGYAAAPPRTTAPAARPLPCLLRRRWITLALTQEFAFPDALRLWDSLLSDPAGRTDCLLRLCVAMLLHVRDDLLQVGLLLAAAGCCSLLAGMACGLGGCRAERLSAGVPCRLHATLIDPHQPAPAAG